MNKALSLVKDERMKRSLRSFIAGAWSIVEPVNAFQPNWHIDMICEHLEAVSRGEISKLLINMPPRHMKSLLVSVFWPCWEWISSPAKRWLFSSYSHDLSVRDSLKSRRLIQSPWFQRRWGDVFNLTSDQNQKTRYDNDKTGYRLSTSVGGIATGEGGNSIVVDDPHNVKDAISSVTKRSSVLVWWDEVMSTRLDNPKTGSKIIVMQRIHESDLSGHVLAEKGYEHLCLPARYEGNRVVTSLNAVDKRSVVDEPLWPERYGDAELASLETELGAYATAGQLQQRPEPRGGGMFQTENFKIIKALDKKEITSSVRYWDKAGTSGGGCYTAGVLVHRLNDKSFVIADVIRGQWAAPEREKIIRQAAELDGLNTIVWVEQEPGSGGKESAENTIRNLAGYCVYADKVSGAKEVRAEPYAIQVEVGNVSILSNAMAQEFIREHEFFPVGSTKDMVDAASGAFIKILEEERCDIRIV